MMDVSEDLYTWHDHRTVDYAYGRSGYLALSTV